MLRWNRQQENHTYVSAAVLPGDASAFCASLHQQLCIEIHACCRTYTLQQTQCQHNVQVRSPTLCAQPAFRLMHNNSHSSKDNCRHYRRCTGHTRKPQTFEQTGMSGKVYVILAASSSETTIRKEVIPTVANAKTPFVYTCSSYNSNSKLCN